jgi:hypothetical protein
MKHGLFTVREIKTDLCVEIIKNCKALTGWPKRKAALEVFTLPLVNSSLLPTSSYY